MWIRGRWQSGRCEDNIGFIETSNAGPQEAVFSHSTGRTYFPIAFW
jgi:hypothetical protein